ncbi:MAG TPA: histidine kinase [Thermoleophilaceae bacterium]|nr:histidine kinase [Thermoleophilaceae bacterium]
MPRAWCIAAALVAGIGSAAVAAYGAETDPELIGLLRGMIAAIPIAVGLGVWAQRPNERFGMLLVGTGTVLAVSTLAELDGELAYTIGTVAGWVVEVLFLYLVLSFPTGRLPERIDRVLFTVVLVVALGVFFPRLFLATHFELPSPYTTCTEGCPPNAFALFDSEPAVVDMVIRPLSALLSIAVMVAVLMRLSERIRGASPLARRVLLPLLVIAAARVVLLLVGVGLYEAAPELWFFEVSRWLLAVAVPAVALAVLYAMLRWRLFAGRALERLAGSVHEAVDLETLRRAFADAFEDPNLELAFANGDALWIDARGREVRLPEPGSGRAASEVSHNGSVVAVLIHDAAFQIDSRVVSAGLAIAGVVLENQRLANEASTATREVGRSRARIAASAERERRRIERDLHDGAQQRLVALRIELQLAEELVVQDPDRGVERLRELEAELDETLEEVRSLAHGVYPPLLADRGLDEALHAAGRRSPIRVDLEVNNVERYAPEIESAVYFCVIEALQNVSKHARGARRVALRLDGGAGSELRFSVRDDGAGAPHGEITPGVGITNMRDRLSTVGGGVDISSTPGVGTTVFGTVPVLAQTSV